MKTKKVEFYVKIGADGRINGPTASIVRSTLAGHYCNRIVKMTIEGGTSEIQPAKRAFYRTQLLPCFVDMVRQEGRGVDPTDEAELSKANLFFGESILGYEKETENSIGQTIKKAKNPYDLSDRDFAGFLEKAIDLLKDTFGVDAIYWRKEAQDWKPNK